MSTSISLNLNHEDARSRALRFQLFKTMGWKDLCGLFVLNEKDRIKIPLIINYSSSFSLSLSLSLSENCVFSSFSWVSSLLETPLLLRHGVSLFNIVNTSCFVD